MAVENAQRALESDVSGVSDNDLAAAAKHARLLRMRAIVLPTLTAAVTILTWELFVAVTDIHRVILPPPSMVLEKFFRFFGLIFDNAIPTTLETVGAFVLASVLGVALAIIINYSRLAREALYPNLIIFQLIPKIALAPMFIIWLGIDFESRVTFSLFITFFPMLIATIAGLDNVDRDMIRLCRSLGASEWQIMFRVRFPYSLPFIFSGMKISITLAIIGVVVGEFITSQAGLGYLILFASSRQETALTLAAIIMLCIVGLLLYGTIVLGERLMTRWYGA